MTLASDFAALSIKRGLTLKALKKSQLESDCVALTFMCCLNGNPPSAKDAELFLATAGSWLNLSASELLSLCEGQSPKALERLGMPELEQAVEQRRREIRGETRRQKLLLEQQAREARIDLSKDDHYMTLALSEADKAMANHEVPVGAVVVDEHGDVIGRGFNRVRQDNDPCGHAEIHAIRQACSDREIPFLEKCSIYVTLEPCAMCSGAIINSRLSRLVYGAKEPKTGAVESNDALFQNKLLNHRTSVRGGVLSDESAVKLRNFFKDKR